MSVLIAEVPQPVGGSVPPFTPHAISVSLPTWKDVVGYEEGEQRVVQAMECGYPRFFIHKSIQKLASMCEQKFASKDERCMLTSTLANANECRSFLTQRSHVELGESVPVRLVQFVVESTDGPIDTDKPPSSPTSSEHITLHVVVFPANTFPIAKQFWQHTGMGISSRVAERCLNILGELERGGSTPVSPTTPRPLVKPCNRHYSATKGRHANPNLGPSFSRLANGPSGPLSPIVKDVEGEGTPIELDTYLEERYGRNLPYSAAPMAKRAMRRRIAGTLMHDSNWLAAGSQEADLGPSWRDKLVTENDIFLFPTGMTAIWHAHKLARDTGPAVKSVCFGFPYTDTLKILEKWGEGCYFFGNGLDRDIDDLEKMLESEAADNQTPILSLFAEFPSNPLLRSSDLPRLRALADKYHFLIVVDDTVGNFVNVEVLPYADIVVSSLSKIFSGDANVMGGSLVLNPRSPQYVKLRDHMLTNYVDFYFDEDALFMERNSRDFRRRIIDINNHADQVCELLRSRSVAGGKTDGVIRDVYYPKWQTREHYNKCLVKGSDGAGFDGGFGGLFSLTFASMRAAQAFFDALPCHKGPSLGTNFTLACPYTILAHFAELPWAARFGVEDSLVRVSVGLEDQATLLRGFEVALVAAETAHAS